MKPIILNSDINNNNFLYIQLYSKLKNMILSRELETGERLPSLRQLSQDLNISITTISLAYQQLLVEGYIFSKPQSGYYVSQLSSGNLPPKNSSLNTTSSNEDFPFSLPPYLYDLSCFDFAKWKKCAAKVFNDYPYLLLSESDPQGEASLRHEISKYIYQSRGVTASPEQIVIGAGTQQITSHLSRILLQLNIHHVSLESPGYLPVQSIFRDAGFTISHISVMNEGIDIHALPTNIPSAVYVSPSNQFPTGAMMPIGKRYELLSWAQTNRSIIIEDDYDSELRYFGKPVPALQGLDEHQAVVYLGSFSSTLFPAIKISYMVLPQNMVEIFQSLKYQYTQTCSKAEQLTLSLFMKEGYYSTSIRKRRNLYARKLQTTLQAFSSYGEKFVIPVDTQSGINITIKVRSKKNAEKLCKEAKNLGLQMIPLAQLTDQETSALIFYYSQLPLEQINDLIEKLIARWQLS